MTSKPVIAGVDGSQASLRAVEWAAMEARRRHTALRLISVTPPVPRMHEPQASPADVAGALRAVSARALDKALALCRDVAPGLPVSASVLDGPVAPAVAASGDGAAMLVVGARGAGGYAAMLLGSVSRHAAGRASCPVVVVGHEDTMAVHRQVAVGIRDPQESSAALAFAFEEAAARGAELLAVHIWHVLPAALYLPAAGEAAQLGRTDPERITAEASQTLAGMLDRWRDKFPDVAVRHDVVRGHPGHILAVYSGRCDLVVIGRHDFPGGGGPGVGTVQHSLLGHARGPVAVVPALG